MILSISIIFGQSFTAFHFFGSRSEVHAHVLQRSHPWRSRGITACAMAAGFADVEAQQLQYRCNQFSTLELRPWLSMAYIMNSPTAHHATPRPSQPWRSDGHRPSIFCTPRERPVSAASTAPAAPAARRGSGNIVYACWQLRDLKLKTGNA